MSSYQFEQSIAIRASATAVEQCITDLKLMHRWLNPALRCEPIGDWSTTVGSKSRFVIQIPFLQPTLISTVVQREPGLVVWGFDGFFKGRDRWECQPREDGTYLINRFEFTIPNAIVRYGFNTFAANLTRQDMQAQLRRLKRVAEDVYIKSGESLPIRVRQPL
ncbi:SRPBCC family protein [Microcoleus sp. FACHB-1515]|uniref:SRPBCC family protein n=1 Tax=Cyanophyceae TaxID=3028117 RepID=UPI001685BAD3|nr:SRPBCC family protein [Microcoleus sp. FACHB-1515]MBD2089041.1 SRPBCC family protein [Microcoleus sp. FACHB-1515]